MNPFTSHFIHSSFSRFKESFLPLTKQLTSQQKNIALIASAIFAAFAAFILFRCYGSSIKKWEVEGEENFSLGEKIPLDSPTKQIAEEILKIEGPEVLEANQTDVEIDFDCLDHLVEDDGEDFECYSEEEFEFYDVKDQRMDHDGKSISIRTLKCIEKLERDLMSLGKKCGKAIDNGDCFWDAFAQGLSTLLGKQITLKDLRRQVSDEVMKLDQGAEENNWLKKLMKNDLMDSYDHYRDHVIYTCEECLEKENLQPIWGKENRDGLILCHLYKVNLRVYSVGCMDDDISAMDDDDNFYWGEDDFPEDQQYDNTIEIALYPGHFLPVKARNDLFEN